MLYWYGLGLGIRSVLNGRVSREAIKNLIVPVNYWRSVEFKVVLKELDPVATDRILDVGSPKLLSLYLASRIGAEVFSTDIDDYFIPDYVAFRRIMRIRNERFHPLVADGRELQFPDNYFTKCFSISVIEHIPHQGDIECIAEIARTLRSKGMCVITVPFGPESVEEFHSPRAFRWAKVVQGNTKTENVFYQRRYSMHDLTDRIIGPSGLTLKKLQFIGETFPLPSRRELADFLHPAMGPIHPVLSALFHTKPNCDCKRLKKPLCAIVTLMKN
jgi:SAM-dependent methyltransferase